MKLDFLGFVWYFIVTTKTKFCLAYRSSRCSRLFKTSCFQIIRESIDEQKILKKIPTIEEVTNDIPRGVGQLSSTNYSRVKEVFQLRKSILAL